MDSNLGPSLHGSVAKFADRPASLKLPVTVSTDQ